MPKSYTTADIAELFPNLMDVKDGALRDKVAAVWSEALTSGCGGKGWTFNQIRAIPFTLLAGKIGLGFHCRVGDRFLFDDDGPIRRRLNRLGGGSDAVDAVVAAPTHP